VQVTMYLTDEDAYLLRLIDQKAEQERKSRSAVILSIIEEHFEKGCRVGEILVDLGVLSKADLAHALELQRDTFADKLLGDVLVSEHGVEEASIARALTVQSRFAQPVSQAQGQR
jgi:hypothetical protein